MAAAALLIINRSVRIDPGHGEWCLAEGKTVEVTFDGVFQNSEMAWAAGLKPTVKTGIVGGEVQDRIVRPVSAPRIAWESDCALGWCEGDGERVSPMFAKLLQIAATASG